MVKAKKTFEKLFWLLLMVSPALDLVNGIWSYVLCGGDGGMLSSRDIQGLPTLSPSFAVRMVMLVLMVAYIFLQKQWKAVLMFAGIGLAWVLSVGGEVLRGVSFSLSADIQYITRFCYCLVVLITYSVMLKEDGRDREGLRAAIDKVLSLSLLVLGVGVLVPYMLGMGFFTYADRMGYRGCRGFFYAGNDITAVMMLMLPVVLVGWLEQKDVKKAGWPWAQAVASAMCLLSMLIIGTKTAFLALAVTLAAMGGYGLWAGLRQKEWRVLRRLAVVLVLVLALLLVLMAVCEDSPLETIWKSLTVTQQIAEKEDLETAVLSGRTTTLDKVITQFREGMPLTALVGVGRGSQQKVIEMDLLEVVFYYGLLGAAAMLWLYLLQGVRMVIDLFRAFSLRSLAVCVALGLCVGYLTLAGHTLFSVTAGFYFAFMIVYARLFCSRDGLETRIL